MGDNSIITYLKSEITAIESKKTDCYQSCQNDSNFSTKEHDKAFAKIIALLSVRDRSEKYIRNRLQTVGFSKSDVEDAIARAKTCGLIDDIRYADLLIHSRLNQGRGALGIKRELCEHDIDTDNLLDWPVGYGINEESEFQRALTYLEAHPTYSVNRREGAYRKLVQKGYSSSVAMSAARTWSEL